jgi:small subunit ribosomal protein S17
VSDEKKTVKKPAAKKAPAAKTDSQKPRAAGTNGEATSRGSRKTRLGLVVSNRMAKTVVVKVERRTQHPLYGKVVIRSNKFKAHDEQNCDVGDRVEIMETRPMSKEKRWRVTRIVEKVK